MSRRRARRGWLSTAVLAVVVVALGVALYNTAGGGAVVLAVVGVLALLGLQASRGGGKRGRRGARAHR